MLKVIFFKYGCSKKNTMFSYRGIFDFAKQMHFIIHKKNSELVKLYVDVLTASLLKKLLTVITKL